MLMKKRTWLILLIAAVLLLSLLLSGCLRFFGSVVTGIDKQTRLEGFTPVWRQCSAGNIEYAYFIAENFCEAACPQRGSGGQHMGISQHGVSF